MTYINLAEGISLTPPDIEQKKFNNIDTKLKKVAPLVRAKARASIVLPVPGGPHNRIPRVWWLTLRPVIKKELLETGNTN
jgi:hypothetical protein